MNLRLAATRVPAPRPRRDASRCVSTRIYGAVCLRAVVTHRRAPRDTPRVAHCDPPARTDDRCAVPVRARDTGRCATARIRSPCGNRETPRVTRVTRRPGAVRDVTSCVRATCPTLRQDSKTDLGAPVRGIHLVDLNVYRREDVTVLDPHPGDLAVQPGGRLLQRCTQRSSEAITIPEKRPAGPALAGRDRC